MTRSPSHDFRASSPGASGCVTALAIALAASSAACARNGVLRERYPRPEVARLTVYVDATPKLQSTPMMAAKVAEASRQFVAKIPAALEAVGYRVVKTKAEPHDLEIVLEARCSGGAGDDCKGHGVLLGEGREVQRVPMSYDTDEVDDATEALVGAMNASVALTRLAATRSPAPARATASPPPPVAPSPTPTAPAPAPSRLDAVVLKDGTRVEGTIVRQEPGSFVVIATPSGQQRTISWDRVAEVETRAGAGSSAAGAPSPGPPAAAASQTTATLSRDGLSAKTTEDCAQRPEDERCRRETTFDATTGGLSFGVKQERVERVKEPSNGSVNFGMDVYVGTVSTKGSDASVFLFGGQMALNLMIGGQFPGEDGGSWSGLAIQPSAAVSLIAVGGANGSSGQNLLGLRFGSVVGYQFLSFGSMDRSTLKQSGFGLLLGAFAGTQGVGTPKQTAPGSTNSDDLEFDWNGSYGPVLTLSFPGYNAGTAHYSAFNISLMLLPTGDSVFVSGGIGGWF